MIMFFIQCGIDRKIVTWEAEGGGVTQDINMAQAYHQGDAQEKNDRDSSKIPWRKSYIERKSKWGNANVSDLNRSVSSRGTGIKITSIRGVASERFKSLHALSNWTGG